MKKKLYILILATVCILSGCSMKGKGQMTDFIPTTAPSEVTSASATPTEPAVTPTPKPIHVGQTTTKYVKLTEYGDQLNVRSAPSTEAKIVGFLVHAEKVKVIEIDNGWASLIYENAVCYVNADFLVKKKPAYLKPPTPTASPDEGSASKSIDPDI